MEAYSTDGCQADTEHAERIMKMLDEFVARQEALSAAAKVQAASEGSKIAQGALKWVKQQVHVPLLDIN